MKRLLYFLMSVSAFSAFQAMGLGDPDFELTRPRELPLWKGAQWVKAGNDKISAKIVEDPAYAASGKRFLRMETPGKASIYVLGYPTQKRVAGHGFLLRVKARGNGLANILIRPYDSTGKVRPWRAVQESGFRRMDPDKWQTLQVKYMPIDGDSTFLIWCGVRDGKVDFDDCSFELIPDDSSAGKPKKAAVKKKAAPVKKQAAKKSPLAISSDFEVWNNGMPAGWIRFAGDKNTLIRRAENRPEEADRFGSSSMFLDGRAVMDPPIRNLAVPRSRPMRLSFYAKGANGRIKARAREGRDGFVDYLIDLADEQTTDTWKKYAVAFSLPNNARIDNATIELSGSNVLVDNVEFKAATGSDGKISYSVPVVKKAPQVDGINSPGEWDFAAGGSDPFQLFIVATKGAKPVTPALLQQGTLRLTSDGEKLYFLMETPGASHMKKHAVKRDDPVFLDDSVEIHINPEYGVASPAYSYQFVINSRNTVFDQRRRKGGYSQDPQNFKWNAKSLVTRSKIVNDVWVLEGCFSLKELGLALDKPFGLQVCANRRNPQEEGTLNGGPFGKLDQMAKITVSKKMPAIYWNKNGDWGSMLITAGNPQAPAGTYFVEYALDAEKHAVTEKKAVYLEPGRAVPVLFNYPGGAGKFGAVRIALLDAKGNLLTRHVLDFNTSLSPIRKTVRELEFHVLHEQEKFALNLHLDSGKFDSFDRVEVAGDGVGNYVFSKKDFTLFEKTLVLKRPFKALNGKNYVVRVHVLDKNGTLLSGITKKFTGNTALIPKKIVRQTEGVLAPYTPIKAAGSTAQVLLRDYRFAGSGLPQQIIAKGRKVLDSPVVITAEDASGKVLTGKSGKFRIVKKTPEKLHFTGESRFPQFTVKLAGTMEYDGAIFYKAQIVAPAPVKVKRLSVEIPFRKLDYFHSFVDSQLRLWMCRQPEPGEYRHASVKVWTPETIMNPMGFRRFTLLFFPYGDGVIWNSRNVIPGVIKNGFLPYLTFGNKHYGMVFFADTDRGWFHRKGSVVHEILRKKGRETLRTNIVAADCTLKGTRSFEFGIMATPAKERRRDDRYSNFFNNAYSHSAFNDQTLSGLRIKDFKLFNDQFKRLAWRNPIFVNCKGFFPQMDVVCQYMDSDWRTRPDYAFTANYSQAPSLMYGTEQRNYLSPAACYTPGRLNYFGERFDEIIRNTPAIPGVYWDENWMKPCNNPNHANCGYHLEDGQVQGRAWWYGVREVDRRVRKTFNDCNRPDPLIVMFTGEGLIPHAFSFGNINYLGEHITFDTDYIDYWTPHFTEIACAGAWGFDVGILGMFREVRFRNQVHLNRAQLALIKLYDSHFFPIDFNMNVYRPVRNAEKRFKKSAKDVLFAGYFTEEGQRAVSGLPVNVKASLFVRPGKGALVYVSNLGSKAETVKLNFDLKQWKISQFDAFNAETQKKFDLNKKVTIKKHDFIMLELNAK